MSFPGGSGMYITECAPHDQPAAMDAEALCGKPFAAGQMPHSTFPANEIRQFGKFRLRDITVEIHPCKDSARSAQRQTRLHIVGPPLLQKPSKVLYLQEHPKQKMPCIPSKSTC